MFHMALRVFSGKNLRILANRWLVQMGVRQCSICFGVKPISSFGKKEFRCKECRVKIIVAHQKTDIGKAANLKRVKTWLRKHPDKRNKYMREYAKKRSERDSEFRRKSLDRWCLNARRKYWENRMNDLKCGAD